MPKFFPSALLVALAWTTTAKAEPAPHQHTVIVPYDPATPVDQQEPENYFLDEATFDRLWKLAKENRAVRGAAPTADGGAEQGHTISSALYRISASKDQLTIAARLSLHTFGAGWNRVPLAFRGAQITAITLDGGTAAYEGADLLVENAGAHTVELQLQIARPEGWRDASWTIPPAAAAMVSLELDDPESRATINDGRALVTAADGTATAAIGNADTIRIQRTSITTRSGDKEAREPSSAQIDARLYITPAIERLEGDFHYAFDGFSHDTFSLSFDPSITPTGFRIPNLKSWTLRKAADAQTLEFVLAQPAEDKLSVGLIGERRTPDVPVELKFPQLGAGARRTERHLALFHVNDLEVRSQPAAAFRRSAPKNRDAASGFKLAAAFNTSGDSGALPYSLANADLERRLEANYVFQIGASKFETVAKLDLISPDADLLSASVTIPAGMKVQSVASARLQDWWIDGQKLQLRFSGLTPDRTTVILNFARALAEQPKQIAFSPLAVEGFEKARGTGLVIAHIATRTVLDFDRRRTDVHEISTAEAGREFEVLAPYEHKHGFAFDVPDFVAKVTLDELEAKFDASWVLLAETFDNWVRIGARVDVELTRAALKRVRFTLPAGLPEARVTGDSVREVNSTVAGDLREYTVSFQSDIVDAAQFDVTTEIPHGGEASLPDLDLPDADRLERFLAVENLSKDELKLETAAAELTSKGMFPYFDETITSKWLYRAREGWQVKLVLEKLETTAGNRAVVLLAELTTALRRNGDQWVSANYRIQNRSLQFLPVKLPTGCELISVKVAGENVRADRSSDGNTYLIPLVQTKPGQLAYPVEIVYLQRGKEPLGSRSNPELDDPDLLGLVIEKTVWNVILPDGYSLKSSDGNMTEVPDQQRQIEQLASMETELIRLNNVAASKKYGAETRNLAKRNAQSLASVYESALEASNEQKMSRGSGISISSRAWSPYEINPQFDQLRETLKEQKALAFSEDSELQTGQSNSEGEPGDRKYYWQKNSDHISSRHNEIYTRSLEQKKRVTGQLNVNDNLILLGDNRIKLEQQQQQPATPPDSQKPGAEGNQSGRRQQLSKLNDQGQSEGNESRFSRQRDLQLAEFNAVNRPVSQEVAEQPAPTQPLTNFGNNARANTFSIGNAVAVPPGDSDAPPVPSSDLTTTLSDAPPLTQGFKPVGRVSLDVDFPTDGKIYHFKKLKDHAVLTLEVNEPTTGNRTVTLGWLLLCLAFVLLGNRFCHRANKSA